ncbi:MAG: hypothetical protein GF384_06165, partial [Elusimicrobia bacterium]|nr:hypothetical protein [Elusimicrobiota bacterium]
MKKALAERFKTSFISPFFLTMDEFMTKIFSETPIRKLAPLETWYVLYQIAQDTSPSLIPKSRHFKDFIPWAKEISAFIDQLDIECIDNTQLNTIEQSAQIGYEIPPSINQMLTHIVTLRETYHAFMQARQRYTRGFIYFNAARAAERMMPQSWDTILFCNFYYHSISEKTVIRFFINAGKARMVTQGDPEQWPILNDNLTYFFPDRIRANNTDEARSLDVQYHRAQDFHAQITTAREILARMSDHTDTLIMTPRPESIIPLISHIAHITGEINVSLGYPISRTSLYSLWHLLHRLHSSKVGADYYARDLLNILTHPLIKNLTIAHDPRVTRIIIHAIEDGCFGRIPSLLSGKLFFNPAALRDDRAMFNHAQMNMQKIGISVSYDTYRTVIDTLVHLLCTSWESVSTLRTFSIRFNELLSVVSRADIINRFPLIRTVMEIFSTTMEEMTTLICADEHFPANHLWEMINERLQDGMISFRGSPLKGVQVLGLYETRALNFKRIIVIDTNESILPNLRMYEPLIPREVMLSLGLTRLKAEEEIQRYHCMRLINNAHEVHLIYEEYREKEKSRFIEELLWNQQRKTGNLSHIQPIQSVFTIPASVEMTAHKKTERMVDFLKKQIFSPTRLTTYLECPARFYFRYVLGLREEENLLDEPETG